MLRVYMKEQKSPVPHTKRMNLSDWSYQNTVGTLILVFLDCNNNKRKCSFIICLFFRISVRASIVSFIGRIPFSPHKAVIQD